MRDIAPQAFANHDVILVARGATYDTVAITRGARRASPTSELSFGRALDIGCAAAKGEVLVSASPHVHPLCTYGLKTPLNRLKTTDGAAVYAKALTMMKIADFTSA